jgi:hypothetical protein
MITIPFDVSRFCIFIVSANYYYRVIQIFNVIAKPFTQLTQTIHDWKWRDVQNKTIEVLKQRLQLAPMLRRLNTCCPFQLHVN